MIIIGIDIGLQGGIATIDSDGKLLEKFSMPLNKAGEVDLKVITKYILEKRKADEVLVVYERFKGMFGLGKKQVSSLFLQLGLFRGVCTILGFTRGVKRMEVYPDIWQAVIFKNIDNEVKTKTVVDEITGEKVKKQSRDTKKMAYKFVSSMYPDALFYKEKIKDDLTIEMIKINDKSAIHDGVVDALCIAVYAKRTI